MSAKNLIFAERCSYSTRRLLWDYRMNLTVVTEVVSPRPGDLELLAAIPGLKAKAVARDEIASVLVARRLSEEEEALLARWKLSNDKMVLRRIPAGLDEVAVLEWLQRGLARAGLLPQATLRAKPESIRELCNWSVAGWSPRETTHRILAELWAERTTWQEAVPLDVSAEGAFGIEALERFPEAGQVVFSGRDTFRFAADGIVIYKIPREDFDKVVCCVEITLHGIFPTENGQIGDLRRHLEGFGPEPMRDRHTGIFLINKEDNVGSTRLFVSGPAVRIGALDVIEAIVLGEKSSRVTRGRTLGRPWLKAEVPEAARKRLDSAIRQQFALGAAAPKATGLSLFFPVAVPQDTWVGMPPLGSLSKSPKWSTGHCFLRVWPDQPAADADQNIESVLAHYFHTDLHDMLGIARAGKLLQADDAPYRDYRLFAVENKGGHPGHVTVTHPLYARPLESDIARMLVHSLGGRAALVELVLDVSDAPTFAQSLDFTRFARFADEAFKHTEVTRNKQLEPVFLDIRLPGDDTTWRILGDGTSGPQKGTMMKALGKVMSLSIEPLSDDRAFVFQSTVLDMPPPPLDSPGGRDLEILLQRMNTVDGFGIGPIYAPEAAAREYADSAYDRFAGFGTHFMATDHSFSALMLSPETDEKLDYALKHIHRNHMANHYHLMIVYAQLVRSELRVIAQELALIGVRAPGVGLLELRERFTEFVALAWRADISSQVQGREIFDLIVRKFGIEAQIAELDRAIGLRERLEREKRAEDATNSASAAAERAQGFNAAIAVVAAVFSLAALNGGGIELASLFWLDRLVGRLQVPGSVNELAVNLALFMAFTLVVSALLFFAGAGLARLVRWVRKCGTRSGR